MIQNILALKVPASLEEYDNDGEFVCCFGEGILENPWDISVAKDGRVMVVDTEDPCVHISVNTATVRPSLNWNVYMGMVRLSLHFIEQVHKS